MCIMASAAHGRQMQDPAGQQLSRGSLQTAAGSGKHNCNREPCVLLILRLGTPDLQADPSEEPGT